MRDAVVDANVLMSMLISGKAIYKTLLSDYTFFSSDFAFIEIEKYQRIIKQKSRLEADSFQQFSYFVFTHVHFMPGYLIDNDINNKAFQLVHDIDVKDISYVALALQLDIPLLTRDVPLYAGLRKKGFRKVEMFDVFLRNV
ncbi:PIN domain-containing protein [Runella slithyformis]|uniref:Nucleotide-binding protein, PIN domain-containing protein n=1 Tax=Runella slithyformis (strain ATCC 29530 / DSM 19594 / LMG 11500 / NCIMB 11436 / LSU 4) TaxID=761193 RepID=A0A7U3ZIG6_RUNSL|nr:PIN domain-containing protein [Runella slithyformis]AEI47810.1 Nucleotide-binding protein, PIN domain-containing protein [Runella slithyformis DSM 19594]